MGFQKRRYAFCTAFKPSPATSNPSQRLWPTPASQPCLRQPGAPQRLWPTPASQTCLFSSYGLPKATLGILRRLQTLPRGFKPFPAPLAYSCIAALPAPAGSLGREPLERAARALFCTAFKPSPVASNPPQRLQTLASSLGSWQACCGLSVACPKPASSLLMGFRRRR